MEKSIKLIVRGILNPRLKREDKEAKAAEHRKRKFAEQRLAAAWMHDLEKDDAFLQEYQENLPEFARYQVTNDPADDAVDLVESEGPVSDTPLAQQLSQWLACVTELTKAKKGEKALGSDAKLMPRGMLINRLVYKEIYELIFNSCRELSYRGQGRLRLLSKGQVDVLAKIRAKYKDDPTYTPSLWEIQFMSGKKIGVWNVETKKPDFRRVPNFVIDNIKNRFLRNEMIVGPGESEILEANGLWDSELEIDGQWEKKGSPIISMILGDLDPTSYVDWDYLFYFNHGSATDFMISMPKPVKRRYWHEANHNNKDEMWVPEKTVHGTTTFLVFSQSSEDGVDPEDEDVRTLEDKLVSRSLRQWEDCPLWKIESEIKYAAEIKQRRKTNDRAEHKEQSRNLLAEYVSELQLKFITENYDSDAASDAVTIFMERGNKASFWMKGKAKTGRIPINAYFQTYVYNKETKKMETESSEYPEFLGPLNGYIAQKATEELLDITDAFNEKMGPRFKSDFYFFEDEIEGDAKTEAQKARLQTVMTKEELEVIAKLSSRIIKCKGTVPQPIKYLTFFASKIIG
jgi:hypothetical protein